MADSSEILQITAVVLRLQKGDESAQADLIDLTQAKLFKFCLLLGHNRELAEDLCQETFIKAIQSIHKLQTPETCIGWMYQIAKNLFIDIKRKPLSKNEVSEVSVKETGSDSSMDLILSVQKVLSQFEPDDRHLILLIELEGYSYKEAGDIVGISEDAVRSKIHRLRAAFIKKINFSETN